MTTLQHNQHMPPTTTQRTVACCAMRTITKRCCGVFCGRLRLFVSVCIIASVGAATVFGQTQTESYRLFQDRSYDAAIRTAQLEISRAPSSVDSYIVLGWVYLTTGQHQLALQTGLDGATIAPNDDRILAIIGEAYYNIGEYEQALPYLERYVAVNPTGIAVARVHALMGEIFIQFGEFHHAQVALATALAYDGTVALWWRRIGFVYGILGNAQSESDALAQAAQLES